MRATRGRAQLGPGDVEDENGVEAWVPAAAAVPDAALPDLAEAPADYWKHRSDLAWA